MSHESSIKVPSKYDPKVRSESDGESWLKKWSQKWYPNNDREKWYPNLPYYSYESASARADMSAI